MKELKIQRGRLTPKVVEEILLHYPGDIQLEILHELPVLKEKTDKFMDTMVVLSHLIMLVVVITGGLIG